MFSSKKEILQNSGEKNIPDGRSCVCGVQPSGGAEVTAAVVLLLGPTTPLAAAYRRGWRVQEQIQGAHVTVSAGVPRSWWELGFSW